MSKNDKQQIKRIMKELDRVTDDLVDGIAKEQRSGGHGVVVVRPKGMSDHRTGRGPLPEKS